MLSHLLDRPSGVFVRNYAAVAGCSGYRVVLANLHPVWRRGPRDESLRYLALPRGYFPAISTKLISLSLRHQVERLLKQAAPALVHAHALVPDAVALRKNSQPTLPLVLTVHNAEVGHGLRHWNTFTSLMAVTSPSRILADRARALLRGTGITVHHLPNPVAPAFFQTARERPDGGGEFRILFLGNMVPEKRPQLAVDIAAECAHRMKPRAVHLMMVGSGPLLRRIASDAPSILHLTIAENLPNSEIALLMAESDVFVSTSLWESFGVAIAEAVASGLPVVSSETLGASEVLEGVRASKRIPVHGSPAEYADAIVALASREDQWANLHDQRSLAESRWSFSVLGPRVASIYEAAAL